MSEEVKKTDEEISDATEIVTTKKEIVIIGSDKYETAGVVTGASEISFKVPGLKNNDIGKFENVTELQVSGEEGDAYGWYKHLIYTSALSEPDGITIKFHQPTDLEAEVAELREQMEASQEQMEATQEALDSLLFA